MRGKVIALESNRSISLKMKGWGEWTHLTEARQISQIERKPCVASENLVEGNFLESAKETGRIESRLQGEEKTLSKRREGKARIPGQRILLSCRWFLIGKYQLIAAPSWFQCEASAFLRQCCSWIRLSSPIYLHKSNSKFL